ncbi:MAG: hypothetical protein KJO43_06055 [Phycisphaerae bacterium]|nr:hypothetical protein [Phycisphaerae bacterium]NNF43883.1 hypothetical protein [Phycisphaerales bacterium]
MVDRAHPDDEAARLRRELEAVTPSERLDYLAALPPERQNRFKRILSRDEIKKLNDHIDRLLRQRAKPTYESWIADARAGRASSPDAMIEALRENASRLRPRDAQWIERISETAGGRSFSKKQEAVIRGIYERYFGSQAS